MQQTNQSQVTCYVCLEPIDEKSDEHIIPNCIGGRLKAKLLCKKHNNGFGSKTEGIFARKMNPFCNLLNIRRERNNIPDQPVLYHETDTIAFMKADGELESKQFNYKEVRSGDQINLHIHAPDDIRKTRKHLKGLKRKYPSLDVEKTLAELKKDTTQGDHMVRLDVDLSGIEIQQTTAKTAINFYLYRGGERKHVSHLISRLGKAETVPVYLAYPTEPVFQDLSGGFLHKILLIGSCEEKLLYCIVDYFSTISFIAVLSGSYEGPAIESTYFFDPVKGTEVSIKYRIPNAKELEGLVKDVKTATETAQKKIDQFLDQAFQKRNDLQKGKHASKPS